MTNEDVVFTSRQNRLVWCLPSIKKGEKIDKGFPVTRFLDLHRRTHIAKPVVVIHAIKARIITDIMLETVTDACIKNLPSLTKDNGIQTN